MHSQYVHPKHPPDKEYREDSPCYVNYPVASCFRFPKIEHAAMVAGGPHRVVGVKFLAEGAHLTWRFYNHKNPYRFRAAAIDSLEKTSITKS